MEQRRNSASPSFHSFDWRSKVRGVDAMVNDATATPDCVKRSSGSAVRLPITVMTVSFAMGAPLLRGFWGSCGDQSGTTDHSASRRMSLVRMTDSLSPSWRSSSCAVEACAVNCRTM